ncbi:hypothetical protein ACXWOP_09955, partial [Streptococcus pyogenes]
ALVNTNDVDASLIEGIWNHHPSEPAFINTDSFKKALPEIAQAYEKQRLIASRPETILGRAMTQAVLQRLYPSYVLP